MGQFKELRIAMMMLHKLHELGFVSEVANLIEESSFVRCGHLLLPDIVGFDNSMHEHTIKASVVLSASELNAIFKDTTQSNNLVDVLGHTCSMLEENVVFAHMHAGMKRIVLDHPESLKKLLDDYAPTYAYITERFYSALIADENFVDNFELPVLEAVVDVEDFDLGDVGVHLGSYTFGSNSDTDANKYVDLFTDSLRHKDFQSLGSNRAILVKQFSGWYSTSEHSYSLLPHRDGDYMLEYWYTLKVQIPTAFDVTEVKLQPEQQTFEGKDEHNHDTENAEHNHDSNM